MPFKAVIPSKSKTPITDKVLRDAPRHQFAPPGQKLFKAPITNRLAQSEIWEILKQCKKFELQNQELLAALKLAEKLCKEALPKFNWGASALDANAISILNNVPAAISAAIKNAEKP